MALNSRIWLAVVVITLGAQALMACSCGGPSGKTMRDLAEKQFAASKMVFEGEVERVEIRHIGLESLPPRTHSMDPSETRLVSIIHPTRIYRGPKQDSFEIFSSGTNCDFDFEVGLRYLVDVSEYKGQYYASYCSGTTSLDAAGPQLRFLRGEQPTADDLLTPGEYRIRIYPQGSGKICGRVSRDDGSPIFKPLITIWQWRPPYPLKADGAITDTSGAYCSDPLAPGKYLVDAFDGEPWKHGGLQYAGYHPGGLHVSGAKAIEVKAGETTSHTDIVLYAERTYTLRGKVVMADGSALPTKQIDVMFMHADGETIRDPDMKFINDDGSFEFYFLPPGEYSVDAIFGDFAGPAPAGSWVVTDSTLFVSGNTDGVTLAISRVK